MLTPRTQFLQGESLLIIFKLVEIQQHGQLYSLSFLQIYVDHSKIICLFFSLAINNWKDRFLVCAKTESQTMNITEKNIVLLHLNVNVYFYIITISLFIGMKNKA